MSKFVFRPKPPRPLAEIPSPGIYRPSGAVYYYPDGYGQDAEEVLNLIDDTLQYEVESQITPPLVIATAIGETTVKAEFASLPATFNVEFDPEIKALREKSHKEGTAIMEAHVRHLCDGEYDKVPLEADAGGTARKVLAVGRIFGKTSLEYRQAWQALLRDCERRVGEAYRVNGWELFDTTVFDFDPETGDFFCDGFSVGEMLRNGLTPATNPGCPEERPRRINEFVELETDASLIEKKYMAGRSTVAVLQCPQSVIDRYKQNPNNRVYSDYAPAIEKLMVRHKRFDTVKKKIYMRQIAVPGTYINNEVVNMALCEMDILDGDRQLDRTEVHGTQAVVSDETVRDVVDMLRRLDQVASRYHGIPIYLGLPLKPGQTADYDSIYQEAEDRRREQVALTERYALRLVELEESGLDREIVKSEADEFIRTELLKIAQIEPEKAEMMFDTETALGFRRANELEAQGRLFEAQSLRAFIEETAPAAGGCGAGRCGLERMNLSEEMVAGELLDVKPGERTAKDTERPCAKCGVRAVVYAWTETGASVKKGCSNCGATEGVKPKEKTLSFTVRRPQTNQTVVISSSKRGVVLAA